MPTGDQKFKILQILEFDSTRKRMSVVIELEDGRLRLLSKGADSAIYDVLSPSVPEVGPCFFEVYALSARRRPVHLR